MIVKQQKNIGTVNVILITLNLKLCLSVLYAAGIKQNVPIVDLMK